jgi:hypothetical protein
LLDSYQTLCSFHAGVHKTGHHFQVAANTAEKMYGALGQRDDRASFFLHAAEGNRGVLIKAQHGLVFQGKGGPAPVVYPNGVAGAKGVIEFNGLPLGFPRPLNIDIPLYRNRTMRLSWYAMVRFIALLLP